MRFLSKFKRDKRGVSMLAIALVIGMVTLGIIIPIGMWTSSLIFNVIDTIDLGASGNITRTTLETNIWNAYNLSTILPIVAVAGVIIAAILGFMAWKKGGM
jgi:Flp pilus assembly pilin Flp